MSKAALPDTEILHVHRALAKGAFLTVDEIADFIRKTPASEFYSPYTSAPKSLLSKVRATLERLREIGTVQRNDRAASNGAHVYGMKDWRERQKENA